MSRKLIDAASPAAQAANPERIAKAAHSQAIANVRMGLLRKKPNWSVEDFRA